MGDEQLDRWDAGIGAAWTGFRTRLADAIASLGEQDRIEAELRHLEDDELLGARPYVQILGWGDGLFRAEAVSNEYLDPRFALDGDAYRRLEELGWQPPVSASDEWSSNFWLDAELRDADRIAWMVVETLRQVFGCVHPAFLSVQGVDDEPGPPLVESTDDQAEEPVVIFAQDRDDLHAHVIRALSALLDTPEVKVDDDGDVPIRKGRSVMFVRVLEDRPAIDLFAQIVLQPDDRARLAVELDILNRTHPLATFYNDGETVVMSYRLVATPFVPAQLRIILDRLLDDVDDLAATLATRVGGRRFLDPPPAAPEPVVEDCPPMAGLTELMRAGRVASGTVAELFEHRRREIVRMIVAVRTGRRDCGDLDEDDVLDHLRRGLDLVARHEARETRAASRLAAGGSGAAQQMSLLDPDTVLRAHRPRRTA